MKTNSVDFEKNIEKDCNLCGRKVLVNERGYGNCEFCGWENSEFDFENPDYPYMGNFMSFNNAKKLFSEGKPLKPNFEEFIEFIRSYGEVEFWCKNRRYGIIRDDKLELFDCDEEQIIAFYASYDDFRANAAIDGKYLKDIWDDEISGVNYLQ